LEGILAVLSLQEFFANLVPSKSAKPVFWERPVFLIYPAAQPDPASAEARLAAESPVFQTWKNKYDRSRRTVTRTDYEVDFIEFLSKLEAGALPSLLNLALQ
jgi:hypothetical protein